MPLVNYKNVYFAIDEETEKFIEEYRRLQTPIPNRSEAIRELVKAGLAAKGFTPPK